MASYNTIKKVNWNRMVIKMYCTIRHYCTKASFMLHSKDNIISITVPELV